MIFDIGRTLYQGINRYFTCVTNKPFFKDEAKAEKAAKGLVEVCEADLGKNLVEHSARTSTFRIKITDSGIYIFKKIYKKYNYQNFNSTTTQPSLTLIVVWLGKQNYSAYHPATHLINSTLTFRGLSPKLNVIRMNNK